MATEQPHYGNISCSSNSRAHPGDSFNDTSTDLAQENVYVGYPRLAGGARRSSRHASLPFTTVSTYIERLRLSEELHKRLGESHVGSGLAHAVTVTGFQGTGKTQLVLRYIEDHEEEYNTILWLDARSEETARLSYERCCGELGLSRGAATIGERLQDMPSVQAVLAWLRNGTEGKRWLVVVDNADDLTWDVRGIVPEGTEGTVVVTSQDAQAFRLLGEHTEALRVDVMEPEEAASLVSRFFDESLRLDEACWRLFEVVAESLNRVPLALALAGAQIAVDVDNGAAAVVSLCRYLTDFRRHQVNLHEDMEFVRTSKYMDTRQWKEAEKLKVEAMEERSRLLGEEHPDTLAAMFVLAVMYSKQGLESKAEALKFKVLEARSRILGEEHPDTLAAMFVLAVTYSKQGLESKAEALKLKVLEARSRILGEEHPDTLAAMRVLAVTYKKQGRWEEAEKLESKVMDLRSNPRRANYLETSSEIADLAVTSPDLDRRLHLEEKNPSPPSKLRSLREDDAKKHDASSIVQEYSFTHGWLTLIERLLLRRTVLREILARWCRPGCRDGFSRLEWQCCCGQRYWGDFQFSDINHIYAFQRYLEEQGYSVEPIQVPCNSSTERKNGGATNAADNHPEAVLASHPALSSSSKATSFNQPQVGQAAHVPVAPLSSQIHSFVACKKPVYLELCVNRSSIITTLVEITLVNGTGQPLVDTDVRLFEIIRTRYNEIRRKRLFNFLYRAMDVHYVQFGVQPRADQVGIYRQPFELPPQNEVEEQRYHYHECPMTPLPPMPAHTFLQYFRGHAPNCESQSTIFCNRLPKKLGSSIMALNTEQKLVFGWGVHIVEGPHKPVLALLTAAIIIASLVTSILYNVTMHETESGFAIGQWMIAVLSVLLAAIYFHFQE